jgi:4-hydroxy-2-oxoheptanedioate aldolase
MGHRGNPAHPEVQAAIESGIRAIVSAGKAAGILIADEALAKRYLDLGCTFVAVGVDTSLLVSATRTLLSKFKGGPTPVVTNKGSVY